MAPDRLTRILTQLSVAGVDGWSSARLCEVFPDIVGATGAGIMLMTGDMRRGSLGATDAVSHLIEDLQFSLGEGPCVDAYHQVQLVAEPDLANPAARRWPAFSPPVLKAGARAIFGFPLRVGGICLGALNLYRASAGPLNEDQAADAQVLADVAASWVLEAQAGAEPDTVAEALELGAEFHLRVHNAAGMVSVQLGVSVNEALIRLRGYAFGQGRLLADVADDVAARRLRFNPSGGVEPAGGRPPR